MITNAQMKRYSKQKYHFVIFFMSFLFIIPRVTAMIIVVLVIINNDSNTRYFTSIEMYIDQNKIHTAETEKYVIMAAFILPKYMNPNPGQNKLNNIAFTLFLKNLLLVIWLCYKNLTLKYYFNIC